MSEKCYCPACGTKVVPAKKYRITVWETVTRCQDVEVLAENESEARRKARIQYRDHREDDFAPHGWEEDRAACSPIYTGDVGRPPKRKLVGQNTLIGMEVEEED